MGIIPDLFLTYLRMLLSTNGAIGQLILLVMTGMIWIVIHAEARDIATFNKLIEGRGASLLGVLTVTQSKIKLQTIQYRKSRI